MKGLGNYSFGVDATVERKPGVLLMYRGKMAAVRFHDGMTFSLPASQFHAIGVKPDDRFIMIVVRRGKKVVDISVQVVPDARPTRVRNATPKVYQRSGRKMITRKKTA